MCASLKAPCLEAVTYTYTVRHLAFFSAYNSYNRFGYKKENANNAAYSTVIPLIFGFPVSIVEYRGHSTFFIRVLYIKIEECKKYSYAD